MAPLVAVLLVLFLASPASPTLAASAPSEFRTGEFIPTARRVQYHGTRSRWVDLASKHCPRLGSDGQLAIPLPAPIVPPTKHQRKHGDGAAADAPPLLHGTYKVQFAFDGERVLTPWLTVAREDLDVGSNKKKKKRRKKNGDDAIVVADVPVVDLVLARAGRELLGGGATRARVSRAPQDYVAAHGGLADEWRTTTTTTTTTNETEQQQQQPAPSTFAAPAPQASSFPPQQQQQLQQQQPLPSIAPPPASFTPQQQYAYYQQMHSYQRQQQQQQQLGQQQLGQGQQAPSSFYSQQQQPAAPSSKAD